MQNPFTTRRARYLTLALAYATLSGCVVYDGSYGYGDPVYPSYDIPPGHMPPPGECRIWYPDLPPGQQPPPGHCDELQYRVPPDAVLIQG
ncbi:hypothetical protein [Litchfieldella qijiaojingensis]|nr:hypothetical protein [Halomonas qijiaojingensis]